MTCAILRAGASGHERRGKRVFEQLRIVNIRRCDDDGKGSPALVNQQTAFDALLGSIGWIGASSCTAFDRSFGENRVTGKPGQIDRRQNPGDEKGCLPEGQVETVLAEALVPGESGAGRAKLARQSTPLAAGTETMYSRFDHADQVTPGSTSL